MAERDSRLYLPEPHPCSSEVNLYFIMQSPSVVNVNSTISSYSVSSIIKTSLGPRGSDKVLVR